MDRRPAIRIVICELAVEMFASATRIALVPRHLYPRKQTPIVKLSTANVVSPLGIYPILPFLISSNVSPLLCATGKQGYTYFTTSFLSYHNLTHVVASSLDGRARSNVFGLILVDHQVYCRETCQLGEY